MHTPECQPGDEMLLTTHQTCAAGDLQRGLHCVGGLAPAAAGRAGFYEAEVLVPRLPRTPGMPKATPASSVARFTPHLGLWAS